jgi:hypothetical protein
MNVIEGTFIHDDCDHAQPGGGRRVKNIPPWTAAASC